MRAFLHEYGLIICIIVVIAMLIALAVIMSEDVGNTTDGKLVKMVESVDETMEDIEQNRTEVKFFE